MCHASEQIINDKKINNNNNKMINNQSCGTGKWAGWARRERQLRLQRRPLRENLCLRSSSSISSSSSSVSWSSSSAPVLNEFWMNIILIAGGKRSAPSMHGPNWLPAQGNHHHHQYNNIIINIIMYTGGRFWKDGCPRREGREIGELSQLSPGVH